MIPPFITFGDRVARTVMRTLGGLPMGIQRRLAGGPIRIDGQTLHPTAQLGIRLINLVGGETFETKPLAHGRREISVEAWVFGDRRPVGSEMDLTVPGPHGPVPARLYKPEAPAGNLPLLVYYHGGGWVLGGLDACDSLVRFLVAEAGICVLSVDYRLAPEHRFPKGLDDSVAAFDHAVAHAAAWGCDPNLVGVAGESAGGNLAAVVSQVTAERARRDGTMPVPAYQVLLMPVTDLSRESRSYELFRDGFFLTASQMRWYKNLYLSDPSEALDPRVSPLLAPDLHGLPPAYVGVAAFDPLRDEGEDYARRLEQAGVPVTLRRFPGATHALINAHAVGAPARAMSLEVCGALGVLIATARARNTAAPGNALPKAPPPKAPPPENAPPEGAAR
ncbi:Acetyl esterase [Methylobacterium hispanicum]|uniref:Acetyl esterase n=3 Tax=Methylobacterium TaxID=407 RepID=A0AAV4ZI20_9HYPH|nr:alpha/beta hydrolase [Methylobacterium hispanicum]GJD87480.1 Acetyl esterase [Methylobacterium hispanicum]